MLFPPGDAASFVKSHPVPEKSVYGALVHVERVNGSLHRLVLDAQVVDCERNATRWSLDAHILDAPVDVDDPEQGLLVTASSEEPDNWTLRAVHADFESHAAFCSHRHERDVRIASPSMYSTVGNGSGSRVGGDYGAVGRQGQPIILGQPAAIYLDVQNVQDQPIEVYVGNITLVNEEAYRHARTSGPDAPPEAERAHLGRIVGCRVEPTGHGFTVPANATRTLTLKIECREDADATPSYRTCEDAHWTPGPAGGERERVEGGCASKEPFMPEVGVWGILSFTDELGNDHSYIDILRQGYHLAREARLSLEAPERVKSRSEFVIHGTYTDAEGRGIPGGGVDVHLDYPGIENHRFAAHYDNRTGEYRFEWRDMMEWRPWLWREGAHEVTVRAQDHDDHEHLPRTSRATVVFE